jgi:hypothetical protein
VVITPGTGALAIDTGHEPVTVRVRPLPRAPVAVLVARQRVIERLWGAARPRGPPVLSFLHPPSRTRFAACGFLAGGCNP